MSEYPMDPGQNLLEEILTTESLSLGERSTTPSGGNPYFMGPTNFTMRINEPLQFSQLYPTNMQLAEENAYASIAVPVGAIVCNLGLETMLQDDMSGCSLDQSNITTPVEYPPVQDMFNLPEWPPDFCASAQLPSQISHYNGMSEAESNFMQGEIPDYLPIMADILSGQSLPTVSKPPDRESSAQSKWICDKCGRDRKTKRDLNRHINACNPEKAKSMGIFKQPIRCKLCPKARKKTFTRADNYQRHFKTFHAPAPLSVRSK